MKNQRSIQNSKAHEATRIIMIDLDNHEKSAFH